MTKIKLCGLKRKEDIAVANELLPDYIGFVFAAKSKRAVDFKTADALKKMLSPEIKAVGVFVNESVNAVAELLEKGYIDIAQLHGTEDEEYINALRKKTSKEIFKAFRIDSIEDIDRANNSSADMVLLDAGDGGTGSTFDWSLLKEVKRDFILAGGLNVNNVQNAVLSVNPYGVDVSSGIETNGLKDPEKMRAFVNKIRNAIL